MRSKTRSRANLARGHKFPRVHPARVIRTTEPRTRGAAPRRAASSRVGHRPVEGAEAVRAAQSLERGAYYTFALFKGPSRVYAHPQKLRLAETIKALLSLSLSRSLAPRSTSDEGTHGMRALTIRTVSVAATHAGSFGQPGLLNPRIGHAHRNHSDYRTRITMQMLVNSHVPAPGRLPPVATPWRSFRAETMRRSVSLGPPSLSFVSSLAFLFPPPGTLFAARPCEKRTSRPKKD